MKQALCAEAIGFLFLVMTIVGSGIMADQLSGGIAPSAVLFFIILQLLADWPVCKFSIWLSSSQNTDNQV